MNRYPPKLLRLLLSLLLSVACVGAVLAATVEVVLDKSDAPAAKKGRKAVTVAGQVVEAGSQKGLGGAVVMVNDTQTKTGSDGRFSAKVSGRNAQLAVVHLDNGLLDQEWMQEHEDLWVVELRKNSAAWTNVVLTVKVLPSVRLKGRVLGPDGQPVPGAMVNPLSEEDVEGLLSAADGTFEIPAVPADKPFAVLVGARKAGLAKLSCLAAGTTETEIKLERGVDVPVTLKSAEGRPAAKMEILATITSGDAQIPIESESAKDASAAIVTTDAKGSFVLKNLPAGVVVNVEWMETDDFNGGSASFTVEQGKPVALTAVRFVDDWEKPGNIGRAGATRCKSLANYCLDGSDRLLLCDEESNRVLRVTPDDQLDCAWPLPFSPQAIDWRADGTMVVAGGGFIAVLETNGAVRAKAALPAKAKAATSVRTAGSDVYVCVESGTGYSVYRMADTLADPKLLVKGLRGCCGQMDFAVRNETIYVAANCESKVQMYDRDGKKTGAITLPQRDGVKLGWDGCCEPKNVCFDSEGNLYTAESASPRVIRFNGKGEYVASVGTVPGIRGCVRVTVAVSRDGKRLYMLDTERKIVRLVQPEGTAK